jgi:hypothetical protein
MAGVSSSSLLRLRRSPVPVMLDGLLQANAIDDRLAIIEDDGWIAFESILQRLEKAIERATS